MADNKEEAPRSIRLEQSELRALMKATVHETFLGLGVDAADPIEVQKDFQHLRDWRKTTDAVKTKGIMTVVGLLVAGLVGLVWVAFGGHRPS